MAAMKEKSEFWPRSILAKKYKSACPAGLLGHCRRENVMQLLGLGQGMNF